MGSSRMPRYRHVPAPGHRRARKAAGGLPAAALAAAAAFLLVLTNVGGSHAYYTAQTSSVAGGTITAGVAGIEVEGAIGVVYTSAQTSSAPAALMIENTGDAPLEVVLDWAQSSGTLSPALVSLFLWANTGTTAAGCAAAPPGGAATGTLAAPATGSLIPSPLPAGGSVHLCALTSLPSGSIAGNEGKSLTGAFTAAGEHGSWTAEDTAPAFTQSVQGSPVNSGAWYRLWSARNPGSCIEYAYTGSKVQQNPCSPSGTPEATELWRFVAADTGYRIKSKQMSSWWQVSAATSGTRILLGTATTSLAAWIVTPVDGRLRFHLVADTSLCATAAGTVSNATADIVLAACTPGDESQLFSSVMLGEVEPALIDPLTCSDQGFINNGNAYLSWPQLQNYQAEVVYRAWVIPSGGTRTGPYLSGTLFYNGTGWTPTAGFGATTFNGYFPVDGAYTIEFEQSVAGAPWHLMGRGYLVSGTAPQQPSIVCGTP